MKSSEEKNRKICIDRKEKRITIKRQAELLAVNRTSIYRTPSEPRASDFELLLMRRIDELHTEESTWGYRKITQKLQQEGLLVNHKRVRRLMRMMGIYALYPQPNLSKRYHAKYVYPYLLRNVAITRVDQVWGVDITYIRLHKGFVYLFVIIDWYSRYIVDYELSTTLDKGFVLTCLNRAFGKAKPDILNSDQGSHFTNPAYIELLKAARVKISMDGKGQCLDNAKTERFFRSLKYDRIYVYEYESPKEIRTMLRRYMQTYNEYRPHSSLGGQVPASYYFGQVPLTNISNQEQRKEA